MSKLDLLLKDLIISITFIADVFPNSNSGADPGVLLVGGTLSDIFWPASTKKELNLSAISEGDVKVYH